MPVYEVDLTWHVSAHCFVDADDPTAARKVAEEALTIHDADDIYDDDYDVWERDKLPSGAMVYHQDGSTYRAPERVA